MARQIAPTLILNYVNEPDDRTTNYDREFPDALQLAAFIDGEHPEWTSYQVVTVRGVEASALDQAYIRQILDACTATAEDAFYQACQIDINAGYRAEVDEAWRIRSEHRAAVKARGYE